MSEQASETALAESGTAAGCVEFLTKAGEKGWFNSGSAKALRITFSKIMSIDEGWEQRDLRAIDVEEHLSRFQTLNRNDYSDSSMNVYKTRFRQAVRSYIARLDDDPNWKAYGPSLRNGSSARGSKKDPKATAPPPPPTAIPKVSAEQIVPTATPEVDRQPPAGPARQIEHRFPLRDDFDAVVTLPRDLTVEEAAWLANFIRTLARPSAPAVS
jgi:hypothetical protein